MKNAVLHCSYAAPVFVSVATFSFFVVVARADTVFLVVADCTDVLVDVFCEFSFGIKTEIGRTERADTVVFNGVLDVIVRVARADVCCVFFVLDVAVSARLAHSASIVHTTNPKIKSKNFFISALMLANL